MFSLGYKERNLQHIRIVFTDLTGITWGTELDQNITKFSFKDVATVLAVDQDD